MNNTSYNQIYPVNYPNVTNAVSSQYQPIQFSQINYKVKKIHPKCKFTEEEDSSLKDIVLKYFPKEFFKNSNKDFLDSKNCELNWNLIAEKLNTGRNARQCRDRWLNYLSPLVENGPWTEEEENLLIEKFEEYGPHWKKISSFFKSRTDINIKSRWRVIERRLKRSNKKKEKEIIQSNQKIIDNLNDFLNQM